MGNDTYRHQGLRRRLVELLKKKGIDNDAVLAAIGIVPRHLFIDDTAFQDKAYEDGAFPIACGQTISQPYTVAFQSQLLQVGKGMKVLEVGTGSGYQCAVLCALGAKVFSIERHRPLYLQTKERLARLGYRASLYHGDGYAGIPREAPFDRIIVTCGAPEVPQALINQVKPGGRVVIPVGEGGVQHMLLLEKDLAGAVTRTDQGQFRFVPMLADKAS
ncbi:MAG: protein-L-isoaspartate(D-aspartate) O-methyltransferase [Flavobacteriales bacterium]|nr:protein-L-isoaspartate(D-aspartate) O-methyltransferase [Flavobacteriales bacterium]